MKAAAQKHQQLLHNFARSKYEERFANQKIQSGAYHCYDGFDIVSESTLRVKYAYGYGDIEYNDSFDIDID